MEVAKIPLSKYDLAVFNATSGILDIALEPGLAQMLSRMDLSLQGSTVTYLTEAPLRAIPTAPNLYANQGESAEAVVQVYERGARAQAGIKVTMSELQSKQGSSMNQTTDEQGQVRFELDTSAGKIDGLVFQPGANPVLPAGKVFNSLVQTYMTPGQRTLLH